jgi:predicted GIY-YIG superfamily endonuclease
MKSRITAKVIVMVMCAFILAGSVALYSGIFTDVGKRCEEYCDGKYDKPGQYELRFACIHGCIFGASL